MKRVVIIGAGPAGLTAAYELLRAGNDYDVVILEETGAIGGISQTVRYHGNRMDIGGHRFFSKSEEVTAWWENIMPLQGKPAFDDKLLNREKTFAENGPDPEQSDKVMLLRDRVSRIYYHRRFFDYPISLKPSTLMAMGFFTTLKAGFSYIHAILAKRPENSLEDFYINRFGKVLYSMFFEDYTEKLWGRHPKDISADWGAQRVKGLSLRAVFKDLFRKILHKKSAATETSLIEQFYYPKFGPGQLWEEVAKEIEYFGGKIITGCKVENLHIHNGKVDYAVCRQNGRRMKIEGDLYLSSMPLKDLIGGIEGDKPNDTVFTAAQELPYRDFVTVGLLVNRLNLKNKTKLKTLSDIVPDCWIYVQDRNVKLGRIQIFNNWSPYMVADPQHTVWVGLEYFCHEGDSFWSMTDCELKQFAEEELKKMGVIDETAVLDSHCERIKKAYPAYFDGYNDIDKIIEYLNGVDNLYCIGRNGQHRYNNMDHSMLTAMRAVEQIRSGNNDKSIIWNVNTEKEYHEKKQ